MLQIKGKDRWKEIYSNWRSTIMTGNFSDLPASAFFVAVKRYFQYLIDDFGFSVVSEEITGHLDVCYIIMKSPEWQINVLRDFGYASISVSSSSQPNRWFGLGDVITFLEQGFPGSEKIWFGPWPTIEQDYASEIHRELHWYAETMRPYCNRIRELFREDAFKESQIRLETWCQMKEKQRAGEVSQGRLPY